MSTRRKWRAAGMGTGYHPQARLLLAGAVLERPTYAAHPQREVSLQTIDTHIGSRIIDRRRFAGWSVEELAEKVGIPPEWLRAYENGAQRPAADELIRLHEALGVPLSYFYEGFSLGDTGASAKQDAEEWTSSRSKE